MFLVISAIRIPNILEYSKPPQRVKSKKPLQSVHQSVHLISVVIRAGMFLGVAAM